MKIFDKSHALHITKPNGTEVFYYLFDEFEVHYNIIPPHSIQEWHRHNIVDESIMVTKGELTVHALDSDGNRTIYTAHPNTLILFERTVHTLENKSDDTAEFIVYRTVLKGEDSRQIFKTDKVIFDIPRE